jgi:hypothetical protein
MLLLDARDSFVDILQKPSLSASLHPTTAGTAFAVHNVCRTASNGHSRVGNGCSMSTARHT